MDLLADSIPISVHFKRRIDAGDEADSCKSLKKLKRVREHLEISDLFLWKLANRQENLLDWEEIGQQLGLNKCEIQQIESKYLNKDGLVECLYQVLLRFKLKSPENCTIKYLESKMLLVFDDTNPKTIMDKYVKQFEIEDYELEKKKLSDKMLWEISELMCVEWKSISRYLGLKESDIFEIERKFFDQDGLRECCYQALLRWSHNSSVFSLKHLCLSLIEQSFNFYAIKVLELLV
ncbi:unnamed protein product [Brachionus calyciflorus]|uniref:Death domain-containing protein n=1 Tax=Brachionus calyciflorus TaxID=104777 RepID=A0A813Q367_9BILA|nr:unnamed protein product [Brachionus calyciflorus]